MALIVWNLDYPDPDNILRFLFHSQSPLNYWGWRSDAFDQYVETAAAAADQQTRLDLFRQADRLLVADEAAIVPLYHPQVYGLFRPGFSLAGVDRLVRSDTFKLKHIEVKSVEK